MSFFDHKEVNTPDSANRIIKDFINRVTISAFHTSKAGIFSKSKAKTLVSNIEKLQENVKELQFATYAIKGLTPPPKLNEEVVNNYNKCLENSKEIIESIHQIYKDFLISALGKFSNKRLRSFYNMEVTIKEIKTSLLESPQARTKHIVVNNENSFLNLANKLFLENSHFPTFIQEVHNRWNLDSMTEQAEVLGLEPRNYSKNANNTTALSLNQARLVSKKYTGIENAENIIVLCAGKTELNSSQAIINKYSDLIKNTLDQNEIAILKGNLYCELLDRTGITRTEVEKSYKGKTHPTKFIKTGIKNLTANVAKELANSIPFLASKQMDEVALIFFSGISKAKSFEEISLDQTLSRAELFKTHMTQFVGTKKEYATSLGISLDTLEQLLKGRHIHKDSAQTIAKNVGTPDTKLSSFINLCTDKTKISYVEQLKYFDEIFNESNSAKPRLINIRNKIGIVTREIEQTMSIPMHIRDKYEQYDQIPDDKMELAFEAYRIPKAHHESFRNVFSKQKTMAQQIESQERLTTDHVIA